VTIIIFVRPPGETIEQVEHRSPVSSSKFPVGSSAKTIKGSFIRRGAMATAPLLTA
jgi:hypothetical protein